jgi:hypothetical protein
MKKVAIPSGDIDQVMNDPPDLSASIHEGFRYVAQTYTAGKLGRLIGVTIDVRSKRAMNPTMNFPQYRLQIAIASVRGGYPRDSIGSVLLDRDESGMDDLVEFPDRIEQVPGQSYAIVASYVNAPPHGPYQWIGNWTGCTGNRYPRGNLCMSADGVNWLISALNDHSVHFCTFVRNES